MIKHREAGDKPISPLIVSNVTIRLFKYSYLWSLLLLLIFFTSCDQDELGDTIKTFDGFTITETTIGQERFNIVEGTIEENFVFTNTVGWILEGGVFVSPGVTLTIEAGTNVYGAFNNNTSFLSIQRGAKIMANGTAEQPITFTTIRAKTSIPQPGDWGGIILNGRAPINLAGGEGEGEGGTGLYGGQVSDDNSGIMRYVIVEYGGKVLGTDNEMNNISLNAVGSGTTIEYIEALYGKDDGIEFFGGTVNIKYAVSLGNADDCIDWTFGWQGNGQFWVVNQDPYAGDKGIEADNNELDFLAEPFSNPTIANITIIGNDDGDGSNTGIRLRHGTKGKIYNAIVSNFAKHGIEVRDSSQNYVGNGDIVFANSVVFNNASIDPTGRNFKNAEEFENDPTNSSEIPLTALDGYIGVVSEGAIDPILIDPWFTSTQYIGAVPSNNDWTSNWVNQLR